MNKRRPVPTSITRDLQRRRRFCDLMVQAKSSNKVEAAAARFLLQQEFNQSSP